MLKTERQRKLLEIISVRRYETMENLAYELGASVATIKRDLIELTDQASFYTKCGKYDGGVYAVDGWYYSRSYLTNDQEKALRDVCAGLQPDMKQIQSILDAFARPKAQKGV